jgi:hypothetical protein
MGLAYRMKEPRIDQATLFSSQKDYQRKAYHPEVILSSVCIIESLRERRSSLNGGPPHFDNRVQLLKP